jgi:hypothetical protein
MYAGDTLDRPEMGTHRVIRFEEGSFGEKMQFKVGQKGWEGIGIVPLRNPSPMAGYPKTVGGGGERPRDNRFEQSGFMKARHGKGLSPSLTKE